MEASTAQLLQVGVSAAGLLVIPAFVRVSRRLKQLRDNDLLYLQQEFQAGLTRLSTQLGATEQRVARLEEGLDYLVRWHLGREERG